MSGCCSRDHKQGHKGVIICLHPSDCKLLRLCFLQRAQPETFRDAVSGFTGTQSSIERTAQGANLMTSETRPRPSTLTRHRPPVRRWISTSIESLHVCDLPLTTRHPADNRFSRWPETPLLCHHPACRCLSPGRLSPPVWHRPPPEWPEHGQRARRLPVVPPAVVCKRKTEYGTRVIINLYNLNTTTTTTF